MSKGIPPRYNTDCKDGYVCVNGVCVEDTGINHYGVNGSPFVPLWSDADLVPELNANPQYYLSMVGKWDRGTSDAGPK